MVATPFTKLLLYVLPLTVIFKVPVALFGNVRVMLGFATPLVTFKLLEFRTTSIVIFSSIVGLTTLNTVFSTFAS